MFLTIFVGAPVTPPNVNDDVTIAITAIADITPTASATLMVDESESSVNISIIAYSDLNPTASATISYDSNVDRSSFFETGIKFEQSKITSIDKRSGFEASDHLTQQVNVDWQQSRLIGDDNQNQFEANKQLTSSSQVSFEQSRLIGDSSEHGGEYQSFIANKSNLEFEQSRLVGHDRWFGFEAMAKRQIERAIQGENAKLLTDKLSTFSDYNLFVAQQKRLLIETARLPFSKLRYVPPNLSQTVILKEQIIEGWECGSGSLRHYVYNDELALPMTRRIADRGASSSLAMPLSMPRGILMLSAADADADAMETRPCKRKTLAVNPTLDVVMCRPKVFGQSSGMAVNANTTFDAIAWLELLIGEKGEAYNKGVIFVTNSVSLTRSDDGREIKLLGFSVGIDSNSYTWSFSATVPLSELSKVNTAYEQQIGVDFTCNGNLWRFILDGCDDSASFGESSLTIKGKSRSMLLAHPYATHRGFKYDTPMSARQIADDELNRFGVPSALHLTGS